MRFYLAKREFYPAYGDIDWRQVLDKYTTDIDLSLSVWFDSDDGLNQECTQENTDLWLSRVHDDSDSIFVLDPRDDMRYSFYRDDVGENFDPLSRQLQALGSAAVHFSLFPQKEVAEVWLNKKQGDLSRADYVPEGWD